MIVGHNFSNLSTWNEHINIDEQDTDRTWRNLRRYYLDNELDPRLWFTNAIHGVRDVTSMTYSFTKEHIATLKSGDLLQRHVSIMKPALLVALGRRAQSICQKIVVERHLSLLHPAARVSKHRFEQDGEVLKAALRGLSIPSAR